jgi:hypothetical protein
MSGEFYDTENASATQAYLRKLHLKAINHIVLQNMGKILRTLKIGYHKPEGELVFPHD